MPDLGLLYLQKASLRRKGLIQTLGFSYMKINRMWVSGDNKQTISKMAYFEEFTVKLKKMDQSLNHMSHYIYKMLRYKS